MSKFFFDECLGKPMMEQLQALVPVGPVFLHLQDKFKQSEEDRAWIPALGKEGDWVVITGDRARRPNRGGKLPELCAQHNLTHVMLSKTLHHMKSHEKVAALSLLWKDLLGLCSAPPGSRYVLQYKGTGAGTRLALVQRVI